MKWVPAAFLLIAGAIHVLPVSGVLGPAQLTSLYAIEFADANAVVLMRHRAVLFALLGVTLVVAAFVPRWRWPAIVAGLVSTLSFLLIAGSANELNESLARVVVADWIAAASLLMAAAGQFLLARTKVKT